VTVLKNIKNVLYGLILIALGIVLGLNALGYTDINLFFDGWWTLIIIIPCIHGLFTEKNKTDNIIGIAVGVVLLLCCQDVISFDLLWKLLVPGVIVVIGIKLVLGGVFGEKANRVIAEMQENGHSPIEACAVFSGNDRRFTGECFAGAELTAVFGGIKWDLRDAVIEQDCVIKVTAVFGGIDIMVSDQVNVEVDAAGIFGGVSNKTASKKNVPTIYVTGLCMFGGVDVK